MNHIRICREPLNVGVISQLVENDSCGGISLFIGTTRDNFEDKKVLSLEYEAYEPMAIKQMESICLKIRSQWSDVVNVAIYHRLGEVPVREASVVIAISSPHRQSALNSVSFAIEELKKHVPIWKKEKYADEESSWKENKELPTIANNCRKRQKLDFSTCGLENFEPIGRNLIQISTEERDIQRRIQCFIERKRNEIDMNNILDYTLINSNRFHKSCGETPAMAQEEFSCARASSVIKRINLKGHRRVRRVENPTGPQIKPDYVQALDNLTKTPTKSDSAAVKTEEAIKEAVDVKKEADAKTNNKKFLNELSLQTLQERLCSIEMHLNMDTEKGTDNRKHIYARLKAIEDRILYLEAISPEYNHFLTSKTDTSRNCTALQATDDHTLVNEPVACIRKRKTYTVTEMDAIIEQMQQQAKCEPGQVQQEPDLKNADQLIEKRE